MAYNLASPNGIVEPVDLDNLLGWFVKELAQVPNPAEKRTLEIVANELASFIRWAPEALLLLSDCDRIPPAGSKLKYHSYPEHIRLMAKAKAIILDGRANGPAIASFLLAGGERPSRFGSSNRWSIHHLYSTGSRRGRNRKGGIAAATSFPAL
jgi:hypothetical protein